MLCDYHSYLLPNVSITPNKTCPNKQPLPFFPFPRPCSPIYFLSLWIYLFWIYHRNGHTISDLCAWLISLSIICSRIIHAVAGVSALFCFLCPNDIPLYKHASACLSILPLMDIWVASTPSEVWGPGALRPRILQIMGRLTLCRLYPNLCLKPLFSVGRLGDLLWLLKWLQMQVPGARLSCRAVDTGSEFAQGVPGVGARWGSRWDRVEMRIRVPGRPAAPRGQDGGAGDHLSSTSLTASISPGAGNASSAAWIGSKIKPSRLWTARRVLGGTPHILHLITCLSLFIYNVNNDLGEVLWERAGRERERLGHRGTAGPVTKGWPLVSLLFPTLTHPSSTEGQPGLFQPRGWALSRARVESCVCWQPLWARSYCLHPLTRPVGSRGPRGF